MEEHEEEDDEIDEEDEIDEVDEEDDVEQHHPPHPLSPAWWSCENTGVELPVYSGTELYCCVRSDLLKNLCSRFISYFFRFQIVRGTMGRKVTLEHLPISFKKIVPCF